MTFEEDQEKIFTTTHNSEGTLFVKSDKGKYIYKLLKQNTKKGKILDLGCNDGGYTNFLRKKRI